MFIIGKHPGRYFLLVPALALAACSQDPPTAPGAVRQSIVAANSAAVQQQVVFPSDLGSFGRDAALVASASPTSTIRIAGIGGNFGWRTTDIICATGKVTCTVARISASTYNAMNVEDLRASYDVLLFTWASPSGVNVGWMRLERFMALGGGIIYEDDTNVGLLAPNVVGFRGGSGPWTVSPHRLLTDGVNNSFVNTHINFTSWTERWLKVFITSGSGAQGLYGEYPSGGRGRIVLTGPDQDFHGHPVFGPNQYQLLANEIRYVAKNR